MERSVKPVDALNAGDVAVSSGHAGYCDQPPYDPSEAYPEYAFANATVRDPNAAYQAVREVLHLLGLDALRYGTPHWNPLGELVSPGQTIVVKPNFVRDFRETHAGHDDCLITHGAIIRAVVDYAHLALAGRGRIVIADAPQNDADFAHVARIAALGELQAFYRREAGFSIEVVDLRPETARKIDGVIVGHEPQPGDPAGFVKVDLDGASSFAEVEHLCHLLYGAEYDKDELRSHHTEGRHEYLVSRTVMEADLVINLPKLKTHKKTGLTACLKNLVGINGNKNWLPHHREGSPAEGGDEFPGMTLTRRLERRAVGCFKRVFPRLGPLRSLLAGPLKSVGKKAFGDTNAGTIRSGNWRGNDTTWRMVHDLNRILIYADAEGCLHRHPVRRVLHLVDAIVAGEGNGPLDATPKVCGAVLAGRNPVAVDLVCAAMMGFRPPYPPVVSRAFGKHPLPLVDFALDDVTVVSEDSGLNGPLTRRQFADRFRLHFGWEDHAR
ncbi:MAG: DUF362 domain-containing protein [Planctomycetes bacterium]|nr:DUF362 domain-containing protein [Planctomycetota bacterium]